MGKPKPSRHAPDEVDAYLAAFPDDVRAGLDRIRSIVHATAPGCTERVSYGIPIFRLQQDLVGMSAAKDHCSLHSMSPALLQAMAGELQGVKVAGATLHFTPDNPLPEALVARIVRARMQATG
jgi:uncharacterized protein YdhG (YjbR/CyaY superfamily)